jgi:hypothetical protein
VSLLRGPSSFYEGFLMPITKDQIIAAMQAAARKLGHAPTTTEFTRWSGINDRNASRLFKTYLSAVRAAGLEPNKRGQRLSSATLLTDWGEVARKVGWVPTRREYLREGRHGYIVFRSRFQRWTNVPKEFCRFVETGSLAGDWTDVLEKIRVGPLPKSGGGKRVMRLREAVKASRMREAGAAAAETRECERVFNPDCERGFERDWAMAHPVPSAVANKKCVTATMLTVFVAELAPSALPWICGGGLQRRVRMDRPLLGAPLRIPGLAHEPVNEMGVILLFGMLAEKLGFIVESVQSGFPDCEAKWEVEPGRWQRIRIEFEYESRNFKDHGHDPKGCDLVVCWRHNWKNAPPELEILELSSLLHFA